MCEASAPGGGSIAWVDEGGLLHVGPESAGSVPGPACYAQGGTRPTVTDAALMLGYLDPDFFLGGNMTLEAEASKIALGRDVAEPLGLNLRQAASAVLRLTTENMVAAIEEITINQGIDPRRAALIGGGGAAGLNAVAIARRLGCVTVIIPDAGAALSAVGAHISELSTDFAALFVTSCGRFDYTGANRVLANLRARCQAFIDGPGTRSLDQNTDFAVEARYAHQVWEMEVPLRTDQFTSETDVERLREDFHSNHREIFAIEDRESEVELIAWRAKIRCALRKGDIGSLVTGSNTRPKVRSRAAFFEEVGIADTSVYHVEEMEMGKAVEGPAFIESPFTTVVVNPGATARRQPSGSLVIDP